MTISRTRPVRRDIATAIETIPAERTTLSAGAGFWAFAGNGNLSCLSAKLLKKMRYGHDALIVIRQAVFFIGRVQAVIGKAKTHQNGRDMQMRRKVAHHRDRSTASCKNGRP